MKQSIMFINAKGAAALMDKDLRAAQRIMARVRAYCKKPRYRPVTVEEFCAYTGAEPLAVRAFLANYFSVH